MINKWELDQKMNLPLDMKVKMSIRRIIEFYNHYEGSIYVSYSGGKDSTVLLHLVRSIFPEIPAVFVDTGLEYPEIVDFVKSTREVKIIRPEMSFKKVLETYGYPVGSKLISRQIRTIRNPTGKNDNTVRLYRTGVKKDGSISKVSKLSKRWLKVADENRFDISERCCDIIKKKPLKNYQKKSGRKPLIGTMVTDSMQRRLSYLKTGCNIYDKYSGASKPLSFWTEDNIWDYIRSRDLPYCSIYDKGVNNTGCIFCMFGAHLEKPTRFEMMRKSHPKQYKYCMEVLKLGEILDYLEIRR